MARAKSAAVAAKRAEWERLQRAVEDVPRTVTVRVEGLAGVTVLDLAGVTPEGHPRVRVTVRDAATRETLSWQGPPYYRWRDAVDRAASRSWGRAWEQV